MSWCLLKINDGNPQDAQTLQFIVYSRTSIIDTPIIGVIRYGTKRLVPVKFVSTGIFCAGPTFHMILEYNVETATLGKYLPMTHAILLFHEIVLLGQRVTKYLSAEAATKRYVEARAPM